MTLLDPEIRLSIQRAMVGEVFSSLQALAGRVEGKEIVLEVYVTAELSDDDMDSITGMEAEILADFPWAEDVRSRVTLVAPATMVKGSPGQMLFARKTRRD